VGRGTGDVEVREAESKGRAVCDERRTSDGRATTDDDE